MIRIRILLSFVFCFIVIGPIGVGFPVNEPIQGPVQGPIPGPVLGQARAFEKSPGHKLPSLSASVHTPQGSRHGMIVAEERLAAAIGADILEQGGNAVDAAVATAFALAVTFPQAGNIGGGGFMMIHMRETGETVALDYREMAPAGATRDMYLDKNGEVDTQLARYSHLSAGVPGTVAGLLHAQEKYGRLSRRKVMAPAIKLADKGYELSFFAAAKIENARDRLSKNSATFREMFKPDGTAYLPGEKFFRKNLAQTLKAISKKGLEGFYRGPVAQKIVADMQANGGLITIEDLANYKVVEREAVKGTYRGYEIHSMPPPSSGGVHLLQMLNVLETRPIPEGTREEAGALHYLAETMRRAYADRAEFLGDPDYETIPDAGIISKRYAAELAATISPDHATPSSEVGHGNPVPFESPDTTHISVIDRDGNMVSNTYTLNLSYGSSIVVPGTGIFLNNEMDDFSALPGAPNAYGLVGGEKNSIEAGKRPLSSMTPTLVFKNGEPFLVTGAPGGSRIITAVLNIILNVIDHNMNIAEASATPRIHHQWIPDQILFEPGLSKDTQDKLEAMGHKLEPFNWYTRPQSIVYDDGWFYGYSDPRGPGGRACAPFAHC